MKTKIMKQKKQAIKAAKKILDRGGTIVFPTETSYGLGADATNEKAVKKIIKIKKQPQKKEISVIVDSINTIKKYAEISEETIILAKKIFPGPLTLVVQKKNNSLPWLSKNTIAFRVPSNRIALEICRKFGKPVTATSANIHGKPPIYDAKEAVKEFFGKVDLIIDSGKLPKRKPSTLFDVANKKVLRKGKIKEKEILQALGK